MQDKNGKLILDDVKLFALIGADSLKFWTQNEGFHNIDDICYKFLSEDLSYRIRQIANYAANIMIHSKRKILKTYDLDLALEQYGVDTTFGYSNKAKFKYSRVNINRTRLAFITNNERHALIIPNEKTYNEAEKFKMNGKWCIVNGIGRNLEQKEEETSDYELMENEVVRPLNEDQLKYFNFFIDILLNQISEEEDSENLFIILLNDLRVNPKLQLLLPYFLSLKSQFVQQLTLVNDEKEFANIKYLNRLFDALQCIIVNQSLLLAPKGYLSKTLSCLLFCIMNPKLISHNFKYDLEIRYNSAKLLAMFLKANASYLLNNVKYICNEFFINILNKKNTNLATIYGITCSLFFLGSKVISVFYENLIEIAKIIIERNEITKERDLISITIESCLLNVFLSFFNWKLYNSDLRKISRYYIELEEIFGDRFTNQINLSANSNNLKNNFFKKNMRNLSVKKFPFEKKIGTSVDLSEIFESYKIIKRKKSITIKFL